MDTSLSCAVAFIELLWTDTFGFGGIGGGVFCCTFWFSRVFGFKSELFSLSLNETWSVAFTLKYSFSS